MNRRSPIHVIKGYFYQFDYSIKRILELIVNDDCATIEGIEDVDINNADELTAIQCKYYEKTEYNHSVIKPAITFMAKHYKQVLQEKAKPVKYHLYGHFDKGQNKLKKPITVGILQKSLLNTPLEIGFKDKELENFISRLDINIDAESYDEQYKSVIELLKNEFNCSEDDADNFYYNNALKVIKDLSTNSDNRTISKRDFIKKIDTKSVLFNAWFLELKGEEKYCKIIRKKYFAPTNVFPYARFFLIDLPQRYSSTDLKYLLSLISSNWSKLSQKASPQFCPYVYLENIDDKALIELKQVLQKEGFKFIDGYDFQGSDFSTKSIIQAPVNGKPIEMKFINKKEFIDKTLSTIQERKEIYQFFIKSPFYENTNDEIKHIMIKFNNLSNIKEMV